MPNRRFVRTSALVGLLVSVVASAGTWTRVNATFNGVVSNFPGTAGVNGRVPGNIALLTDGRILLSANEDSNEWWTLTPNVNLNGSYASGAWNQVGYSAVGRWANPSAVLISGKYLSCGGEYTVPLAPSECEEFDPVSNTWSTVASMSEDIEDSPSAVMADGRFLDLSHQTIHSFIYDELLNSWSSAASYSNYYLNNEGSTLLLRDGTVLAGSFAFERYLPSYLPGGDTWWATATTPGMATNEFIGGINEIGPFALLHDGGVLLFGGNSNNGFFQPPTSLTGSGAWSLAPTTPYNLNHGDAAACVESDGTVFTITTNDPTGGGQSGTPSISEFNNGVWLFPNYPNGFFNVPPNRIRLLDLPSGDILVAAYQSGEMWLYTPAGTASAAWRPTISSTYLYFGEYVLTGTQLNGLTNGCDLGDDAKLATNYPLVFFVPVTGGARAYARTYSVDQMAPRPGMPGLCKYVPPPGLTGSPYIAVAASGISSTINAALYLPTVDIGPAEPRLLLQ